MAMRDKRLELRCPCGFGSFDAKEMVDHMFTTKHGLPEDMPDEPGLRAEMVEALSRVQLDPEGVGKPVDAEDPDLPEDVREALEKLGDRE